MKHILITNDDGYDSAGLLALAQAVRPLGRVTIVAPASEKSACGHSLTLTRPLRFVSVGDDFYKLEDGTPSDCIYLALNSLFEDKKPDLILSGINKGSNMGEDITYSGTASAAMEGVLHGVPSIALSQVTRFTDTKSPEFDFTLASEVAFTLVRKFFEEGNPLSDRQFLNVNIPNIITSTFKGYKTTRVGYRHYGNDAHMHRNPRGEEHYWLGLHPLAWGDHSYETTHHLTDFDAIDQGYVSLSPIQLDMTAYRALEHLDKWL